MPAPGRTLVCGLFDMLKRIRRSDVCVGMYIDDIEGADGRSLGLVKSPATVADIHQRNLFSVIIDTSKGMDVGHCDDRSRSGSVASEPVSSYGNLSHHEVLRARKVLTSTKPIMGKMFSDARLGKAVEFNDAAKAVDQIISTLDENPIALIEVTRLRSKDENSFLHSIGVSTLMIHFGRWLGYDQMAIKLLGVSGLVHDIGKMALPSSLLQKAGDLTDDELAKVRTHPSEGHALLARHGTMPNVVMEICLNHHERLDGTGYPRGIAQDDISKAVRIASICDVYDAMTTIRPYKRAWSPTEAFSSMFRSEGQFDRRLLWQFIQCLDLPGGP